MKQMKWCSFYCISCLLSFCPTHILRASGALDLLFSLQVDATCLNVLGTECFIILSLLFPYYLCLPLPTPFTAEARGTQWGWSQSVSLESMPEGTHFHRDENDCYHSSSICTDICSLGERFINLRECLKGGTSGSVTRSRMPGWWERCLREHWGNCLIHSQ